MLFDLRARGRRRVVKVVYLGLAILLGGGLVLFGIGGDVQGGLFDAFREGGGSASEQTEERRDKAAERTRAQPGNPALWARLAEAEYQLAGQSEGFNSSTGEFAGEARKHLEAAKKAWERHLALAGDKPDVQLAGTMKNALAQLGDNEGAVRAQEIVLESRGDEAGFGDYAQLAQLAYTAGQTRKGDLAAEKAVDLAPKDQKKQLETALEAAKTQGATGGAAAGQSANPGS